ncbi:hypothetical protein OROGR_024935 [Orobanche gracilis]
MANIAKLVFIALDISGNNYMSWTRGADVHLISRDLGDTIKEGNKASEYDHAKVLISFVIAFMMTLRCNI